MTSRNDSAGRGGSVRFGPRSPSVDNAPNPGWERALVTGASSGIGRSVAELLAERGVELVLVARNRARLEALAEALPVKVEVLVADLSNREAVAAVASRLAQEERPIDVLINNAGFGKQGDFIELDPEVETSVIDVNVTALHRLAHAAGGAMAARGRGWILNVSSIAGFSPSPRGATYAASKAFVTSFSEALHVELGPQGVVVTCLCPGLTHTEFQERAGVDYSSLPDRLWQTAEEVARSGLAGLATGKAVVVPGAQNKAIRGFSKAAPSGLMRLVGKATASRVKKGRVPLAESRRGRSDDR